jgi:DNA-binding CsgD family transcriptional regulator
VVLAHAANRRVPSYNAEGNDTAAMATAPAATTTGHRRSNPAGGTGSLTRSDRARVGRSLDSVNGDWPQVAALLVMAGARPARATLDVVIATLLAAENQATSQAIPPSMGSVGGCRDAPASLATARRVGWITTGDDPTEVSPVVSAAGHRLLARLHNHATSLPTSDTAAGARTPHAALAVAFPSVGLPLTTQEQRIAVLVAAGHTSREIATQLGCRPRTVDNHVDHIMTRLDLHNRHELTRAAAADPDLSELIRIQITRGPSTTPRRTPDRPGPPPTRPEPEPAERGAGFRARSRPAGSLLPPYPPPPAATAAGDHVEHPGSRHQLRAHDAGHQVHPTPTSPECVQVPPTHQPRCGAGDRPALDATRTGATVPYQRPSALFTRDDSRLPATRCWCPRPRGPTVRRRARVARTG